MPPVSAGAFARLFDGLDAETRRAFVADLYAARGWEVREGDDSIHVQRNGDERRVAIVEPPRFRPVALPDADEVIVTRDRDRVRSAAAAAGVPYRSPVDLRDLLLYGVDREAATALFETYFDRPLSVVESTDEGIDARGGLAGLRPSVSWNTRQVGVAFAVLLVVAVWAGSVGMLPVLDSEVTAPEVTGTYTPGTVGAIGAEQEYPPGLGEDGIENSGKLTLAHYEYLNNQSYAYHISASGPQHAPFMRGLSKWNGTVRVQDRTRYQYRTQEVAPYGFRVEHRVQTDGDNITIWQPKRPADVDNASEPEVLDTQVYANGTEKFWRFDGPEQVGYRRASIDQGDERTFFIANQVVWVDLYIQQFLWTENSSITCHSAIEIGNCETFRVEATGEPVELRGDTTDFRAVAIVDQPGFVRELTVEYEIPSLENRSRLQPVRFHLEYINVTETGEDISSPKWLAEAKNRTAETDTSTETPTANGTSLPPT